MSVNALQKELDDRTSQSPLLQAPIPPNPLDGIIGYWFVEALTDRTTVSNLDWDTFFDDPAYDRDIEYIVTAGGKLMFGLSDASPRDRRCRIAFQNDGPPYTVRVTLDADTLGELQVKVNGEYNRYTTSPQDLTWLFRNGPNEVQITIAENASRFELTGALFDGKMSKWMPMDWRSPYRR